MGGVETLRMLFTSAEHSSDRGGLGNAGDQLGRGFSDHLMVFSTIALPRSASHVRGFPTHAIDHFRTTIDRRTQNGFFMHFWPGPLGEGMSIPAFVERATQGDSLSLGGLRGSVSRGVWGASIVETEGTWRLGVDPNQKDSWGIPEPTVKVDLSERDRAALAANNAGFEKLAEAMGGELLASSWSATQQKTHFASHPSGGAAMGRSPDQGVVDRDSRVFGKANLYLAATANFPHLGSNTPTLQVCAFALRLADHLTGAA
jgi:hypothetical protein